MIHIIPFNDFPMKQLNIKAYCRRSWGNYYQEKVKCKDIFIDNSIKKTKQPLKFQVKNNYKKTCAERFGIKFVYAIFFILILYIIIIMFSAVDEWNSKETIIEKIYFVPYFLFIITIFWIYVWLQSTSILMFFGKKAWWINPFAWYQIFFYHKIVHNMNNIYSSQWKLCLCELYVTTSRNIFFIKNKTYLSHYGYIHKNKDKLLPINSVPEENNYYWEVDNYILCVYSDDVNIPIPLDKELNCISCLNIYEKEKLHQKITQAIENYFNPVETWIE